MRNALKCGYKGLIALSLLLGVSAANLGIGQELAPVRLFDEGAKTESLQEKVKSAPEAPVQLTSYLSIHPYRKNDPLGDRTPLILVHGIGGDANHYHWGHFLSFTDGRLDFQHRYKVYLVHYNSEYSVAELSSALSDTLRAFIHTHGDRPVRIIGYSEGGLLTRNAMQDPFLNEHTQQVITIATPFHGSPLANPEWIERQVKTEPVLSPLRMTYKMAYWVARKQHPSFETDFHWDNFDQAIAAGDYEKNYGRRGPVSNYVLGSKKNFITYGSFFGESVDGNGTQLSEALDLKQPLREERPKIENLFRKNVFFSVVQKSMAALPHDSGGSDDDKDGKNNEAQNNEMAEKTVEVKTTSARALTSQAPQSVFAQVMVSETVTEKAKAALQAKQNPVGPPKPNPLHTSNSAEAAGMLPLMAYNDGISPISSTLWLGRYTPRFPHLKTPGGQAWAALKSLKGQRVARLFHGLDHRNWMEGETRHDRTRVKDLLNPDESPKTVFEWLVYDLMHG